MQQQRGVWEGELSSVDGRLPWIRMQVQSWVVSVPYWRLLPVPPLHHPQLKTYTEFVTITDKLSTVSGSLGGDCANLGITLSNSSSSSPPSLSDNGSSSSDTIGPKNLLMVMLVIGLIFVRTR
ncbi:EGF [Musa troglodytarum]|uniref:EGF n=1 Tax=Musa troglodytarum TaxID=320322 RepID=A0A9E7GKX7_9LILI|nr:EGF [Musa troglodytarum]URE17266.1 EGF [Musa troglodytarum]